MILETERLILRQMSEDDFSSLCEILQDSEVMYAYEHAFSDDEVAQWLNKQKERYEKPGFGLLAVVLKENGKMIGQCGITEQDCFNEKVLEVGYLFNKKYWGKGYATEAAAACRDYAFDKLDAGEVFSIIRDNNISSQKVAVRCGMTIRGCFVKHYYNIDMPHLVLSIKAKK